MVIKIDFHVIVNIAVCYCMKKHYVEKCLWACYVQVQKLTNVY